MWNTIKVGVTNLWKWFALVIGIIVTVHHIGEAFPLALDVVISEQAWRDFADLRICGDYREHTVRTTFYNAYCALLIGSRTFFGYFSEHWVYGFVAAWTIAELLHKLVLIFRLAKKGCCSSIKWLKTALQRNPRRKS